MDNAECSAATMMCECDRHYYAEFGTCYPRKLVPQPCSVGQCVKDAHCSPNDGVCQCKPGFFVDNGRCSGSKSYTGVREGGGDGSGRGGCCCCLLLV